MRQLNLSRRQPRFLQGLDMTSFLRLLLLPALLVSATCVAQQPNVSRVQVDEVQKQRFAPTVTLSGTLFSRHNLRLSAGISGRIAWAAEPGSQIREGQPVVRFERAPFELALAERQAQLERATINLAYLQSELKRMQGLDSKAHASAFELEQSRSRYQLAKADLRIARIQLQQAEEQLSRTVISVPFNAVVSSRLREAGSEVNRGEHLVQVLDQQHLEGRIQVPIKYLPYVQQAASIQISNGQQQLAAPIKSLIPEAEVRSQSFEVRVSLPTTAGSYWLAGQLFSAELPTQAPSEQLTVHRDALILREDGTYVMVIDQQNRAFPQMVTLGQGHQERISVQNTRLKAGDRVAIRGAERLSEGSQVQIDTPPA